MSWLMRIQCDTTNREVVQIASPKHPHRPWHDLEDEFPALSGSILICWRLPSGKWFIGCYTPNHIWNIHEYPHLCMGL